MAKYNLKGRFWKHMILPHVQYKTDLNQLSKQNIQIGSLIKKIQLEVSGRGEAYIFFHEVLILSEKQPST